MADRKGAYVKYKVVQSYEYDKLTHSKSLC